MAPVPSLLQARFPSGAATDLPKVQAPDENKGKDPVLCRGGARSPEPDRQARRRLRAAYGLALRRPSLGKAGVGDRPCRRVDLLCARCAVVMTWNNAQTQAVPDRWVHRPIMRQQVGGIAPTRLKGINLRRLPLPVKRYADPPGCRFPMRPAGVTLVRVAGRVSESLLLLIDDLLDLAQIERGQFALRLAPVKVHDWLVDCADAFKPVADLKGVSLKVAIDPSVHESCRSTRTDCGRCSAT